MVRTESPKVSALTHLDLLNPVEKPLAPGRTIFEFNGAREPVLQLDLDFAIGKRHQNRPLVASMMVEMLLEGSNGKSGVDMMNELDGYGAYLETTVTNDRTTLSVFCTTRYFEQVLGLVGQIVSQPDFPESAFEKVRNNLKQRFIVQSEKVSILARRGFLSELFSDHPYGSIASASDYDNISLEDCCQFYQTQFAAAPITALLAGEISGNESKTLEGWLNGLSGFGESQSDTVAAPNVQHNYERLVIPKEGALQCGLRIGNVSVRRDHPDFPHLQILMVVFGGYFGSRLMANIREDKGYTYGIGAGLVSYDACGMMYIATEIGKEYLESTISEIDFEINRLHQDNIPEIELDLVKNYIRGSLARSMDGPFAMMDRFKSVHYSGLQLDYFQRYLDIIAEESSDHLRNLAQNYLNREQMLTVVAG